MSGGESFGSICSQFIQFSGVRRISVSSNSWLQERTIEAPTEALKESDLDLFVVELTLGKV
jgi:hypothetical protein